MTCRPGRCCVATGMAAARLRYRRLEILGRKTRRPYRRKEWSEIESGIARSFGTCMVMGTAATMMAIIEALGLTLPGASSIPAPDANHPRMCAAAGRRIVDMVWEDLTPQRILTPAAFDNAIRVHMALGGSTNAIIHVIAMARRAGIALDMKRFDEISRARAGDRQHHPVRQIPDGGFLLCGRPARADGRDARPLDLSCTHRHRRHDRRKYRRRQVHLPDVIHAARRRSIRGRDRRAHRQSRTAWLRDETGRRRPAFPQAPWQGDRLRKLQSTWRARSSATISTSRRTTCWCCKMPDRKAGPACRNGACCRSRRNWSKRRARHGAHFRRAHERHSYGACILHVAPESFVGGPLALVQTGDEI